MLWGFINIFVALNGLYDIICAFSILLCLTWRVPVFLSMSVLHANMFKEEEHKTHPVIMRFLAYWLLTYGTVRLVSGLSSFFGCSGICAFAALTYFIEAICFAYELVVGKTMIPQKVFFVSILSGGLGLLVLYAGFHV